MPTQQETIETLISLQNEIIRKGFSDRKDLSVVAYHRVLQHFDTLIAAIEAITPAVICPSNWTTCSCLFHLQMREAYAEKEREKELRLSELGD